MREIMFQAVAYVLWGIAAAILGGVDSTFGQIGGVWGAGVHPGWSWLYLAILVLFGRLWLEVIPGSGVLIGLARRCVPRSSRWVHQLLGAIVLRTLFASAAVAFVSEPTAHE